MQFEDAPPKPGVGKLEGWCSVSTFYDCMATAVAKFTSNSQCML